MPFGPRVRTLLHFVGNSPLPESEPIAWGYRSTMQKPPRRKPDFSQVRDSSFVRVNSLREPPLLSSLLSTPQRVIGSSKSPLHQMVLSRQWYRQRINNPTMLSGQAPYTHAHSLSLSLLFALHLPSPASFFVGPPPFIRARSLCTRPKQLRRIICSTRFDTRVSVVSYLRSNVAPSTRNEGVPKEERTRRGLRPFH